MNLLSLATRLPILTSVIIICLLIFYNGKKSEIKRRKAAEDYLERERRANSTRRMSLDSVDFIVIPYDELPMNVHTEDQTIAECVKNIRELEGERIANFTGITNTDLKLEYGAPNITQLSRFDQIFTLLCRILQDWAERLYELECPDEALTVLEFAIRIRSDVSHSYYLAAQIYETQDNTSKIAWLMRTADTLNSAMRPAILRNLKERYPEVDGYE